MTVLLRLSMTDLGKFSALVFATTGQGDGTAAETSSVPSVRQCGLLSSLSTHCQCGWTGEAPLRSLAKDRVLASL